MNPTLAKGIRSLLWIVLIFSLTKAAVAWPLITGYTPASDVTITEEGSQLFTVTRAHSNLTTYWIIDGSQQSQGTDSYTYVPDYSSSGSHNVTALASNLSASEQHTWGVTVTNVNRAPSITPIADKSVNEYQLLQFTVAASDPDNDTLTYFAFDLPSGAGFDAGTKQFSWTPSFLQAGTYNVTFGVADASLTDFETVHITVANVNQLPVLNPIGPRAISAGNLLQFSVSAYDADNDNLNFFASGLPSGAGFDSQAKIFSWTPATSQIGNHNITFYVSDGLGTDSETITVAVTYTQNLLSMTSPTGLVSDSFTTLDISSSLNSSCRYGTEDDSFVELAPFSRTTGYLHTVTLTGLGDGFHTYHVKCLDNSSFVTSSTFTFEISKPPEAVITLSPASPVKPGIIEVTLETTKALKTTPKLQYSFDKSGTTRVVSLEKVDGYDFLWKGLMIILTSEVNNVESATFGYEGTDLNGIKGASISAGKTFVVDNTIPDRIPVIEASPRSDGGIKVNWAYSGEPVGRFRVYRSTSSGIDELDYYLTTANKTGFIDGNLLLGVRYYYRVSAVDDAGNEGPLSSEVSAVAVTFDGDVPPPQDSSAQKGLSLASQRKLNETVKELDRNLIDLTWILSNYGNLEGEADSLAKQLKLQDDAKQFQKELTELKNSILALDVNTNTEAEFASLQSQAEIRTRRIRTVLPSSLEVNEQTQFLKAGSLEINSGIADKIAKLKRFPDDKSQSFIKTSELISEPLKVELDARSAQLSYLEGATQTKTYLDFEAYYESTTQVDDVYLVLDIPKAIAEHASEIKFGDTEVKVLRDDPLVAFSLSSLGFDRFKVSIVLDKQLPLSELRGIEFGIVPNPDTYGGTETSGISGFATLDILGATGLQAIGIIAGVLIIAGLLFYYFVFLQQDEYGFKLHNLRQSSFRIPDFGSIARRVTKPRAVETPKKLQEIDEAIEQLKRYQKASTEAASANLNANPSQANSTASYLQFADGTKVKNLVGLKAALDMVSDEVFSRHVNEEQNQISDWVKASLNQPVLARTLRSVQSRKDMTNVITAYLHNEQHQ